MDIVMLIIALALGLLIGTWAHFWGRNPFGWGIAGFFLPLPAGLVLAVVGKSALKKAEEALEIERLTGELHASRNQVRPLEQPGEVGQNFDHRT